MLEDIIKKIKKDIPDSKATFWSKLVGQYDFVDKWSHGQMVTQGHWWHMQMDILYIVYSYNKILQTSHLNSLKTKLVDSFINILHFIKI